MRYLSCSGPSSDFEPHDVKLQRLSETTRPSATVVFVFLHSLDCALGPRVAGRLLPEGPIVRDQLASFLALGVIWVPL